MKTILKQIASIVIFALFLNINGALAATSTPFTLEAYGIDTIAGYSAHVQSSQTLPNKTVIFTVEKPDGTQLTIPIQSDDEGRAEFDLYDYHTKQAGEYGIWARLENGQNGNKNTFIVYADEVSEIASAVEPSKLLATSDGLDKIYVTVTLKDRHDNPIQGHSVEVISSRSEDTVQRISGSGFTSDEGKIMFALSSNKKGVSIYSFLDTTTNKVLDERLEVAYTNLNNSGGDIPTAYAAAGEVSLLEFGDFPSTILPNSDISFSLTALDSENDIVPNYVGTVHFSAEGSNSIYASLPNDYTYDIDLDSGEHTFSGVNSLNFSQPGTYTIVATDLSDFTIRGETDIVVGTSSTTPSDDTTPSGSSSDLVITTPTAGTYSDSQLEITGTAPSDVITVQVFDNDQNVGSTTVQSDNTFEYTPSLLADGEHTVFVVGLDSEGSILETSDEVDFTIDTSPPLVEDINFSPKSGVKTGDIIDITVVSDPNVFQGAVVFNIDIAELEQDSGDPTIYTASIQAPAEPGVYSIDVILVDELGNEGNYEDVASIEISESGDATINGEDQPDEPDEPADDEPTDDEPTDVVEGPGDVTGVKANSSDQKVTLSWNEADSDAGIDHYKIYYGLTPQVMNMTVDTLDDSTTWYIPNLQNGNEYFFSIAAVDTLGNESENKSSIVSGIPFSMQTTVFVPPTQTQPTVVSPPPRTADNGPEVAWFLLSSIFIVQLYFRFRKKVC